MLRTALFILFCFSISAGRAQTQISWDDFADVRFELEYNKKEAAHLMTPKFGSRISKMNGKEVEFIGYFLDISADGSIFLISSNPMATCFFCGAAGPESVVELQFESKPNFNTDDVIRVSGILELNINDANHFNYILKKANGALVE